MLIGKSPQINSSEIVSESVFLNRRKFLRGAAALGAAGLSTHLAAPSAQAGLQAGDDITPEHIVTSYNNFYEFGTDKSDPAEHAHTLTTDPWSVTVSGEAHKTGIFALEDILNGLTEREHIYRFRCVETWSMVVPWLGVSLRDVLKQFDPKTSAKYVEFKTLVRPKEMRGQRSVFSGIDWPYVEGLRLDEAYHPLSIMVTGVFGKPLPNQNGAPWRLMVPWKYGFKSVKSIVSIRFTERQPKKHVEFVSPAGVWFLCQR